MPDCLNYSLSPMQVITFDDISNNFSQLFENICKRRESGIIDYLYIPLNNVEAISVDYSPFLSAALSFEGEYTRLFPNEKYEKDEMFSIIRDNVINYIDSKGEEYINDSNKKLKKAQNAFKQIREQILYLDSTLEEKFNRAVKRYDEIIGTFNKTIEKEVLDGKIITNWGNYLSEMRNHIGHGNPQPIKREQMAVFRLTRCLIYVLILKESSVDDS